MKFIEALGVLIAVTAIGLLSAVALGVAAGFAYNAFLWVVR